MIFNCQFILLLLFVLLLSSAISLDIKTGTIYKLHCQVTGKVYIGSTTVAIDKAMKLNKSCFERYKRGKYKDNLSIFDVMANNDYNVTILELIHELANDTNFTLKLRKLQKFYINENANAVNKYIPTRTKKEYYVENIDHKLQYQNGYYKDNRGVISQKKRVYYLDNKDVFLQRSKEHYIDNRELVLQRNRERYQRIKSSLLPKVTCEVCGAVCAKQNLSQHKKSKRHLTALAMLSQSDASYSSDHYHSYL